MSDRESLMDFYELTTGKFWYQKWNWGSDLGYKQWFGLQIDSAGHVVLINLRENNLQGSLKEFHLISKLVNLSSLSLFSNFLFGSLPDEIGSLSNLRELNLSFNKFSGQLPHSFYCLRKLRMLKLDHNQFSGEISEELAKLKELRHLNFSNNCFTGEKAGFKLYFSSYAYI
jgi:Leucine-rich repeat (LRR) protein